MSDEQPRPTPNASRPVWDQVIDDMRARDQLGRQRYGAPVQAGNGRDALRDAYEEALDLAVYLKQAMLERAGAGGEPQPPEESPPPPAPEEPRDVLLRAQTAEVVGEEDCQGRTVPPYWRAWVRDARGRYTGATAATRSGALEELRKALERRRLYEDRCPYERLAEAVAKPYPNTGDVLESIRAIHQILLGLRALNPYAERITIQETQL